MEDNQVMDEKGLQEYVVNLIQKAMSGDEEANLEIESIMQEAENGNEQAAVVASMISEVAKSLPQAGGATDGNAPGAEEFKCGGKVRAKIKKQQQGDVVSTPKVEKASCGAKVRKKAKKCAEGEKLTKEQEFLLSAKCGGKVKKAKGEEGLKFPKATKTMAKGGCPCQLKKVGGRIILVNSCTGMPMHKSGGSIYSFQPGGSIYVGKGANTVDYLHNDGVTGLHDYDYYIDRDGKNKMYAKGKDGKIYRAFNNWFKHGNFDFVGGDNFSDWEELSGDDLANAQKYFGNDVNYVGADGGNGRVYLTGAEADAARVAYESGNKNAYTYKPSPVSAGTTPPRVKKAYDNGDMSKEEVERRQLLMLDAGMNIVGGKDGKWGDSSKENWNTYLQTRNANGLKYTNQDLLNMTDELAAILGNGQAAAARNTLLSQLAEFNQRKQDALKFGGVLYSNADEYNAAVNKANIAEQDRVAGENQRYQRAYQDRRAAAIGNPVGDLARANREEAYDNAVKYANLSTDAERAEFMKGLSLGDRNRMLRQIRRDTRAGHTLNSGYYQKQLTATPAKVWGNYSAPALPTEFTLELLNGVSYRNGGIISYSQYLK